MSGSFKGLVDQPELGVGIGTSVNRQQTASMLFDNFTSRRADKINEVVQYWELYGGLGVFPFKSAPELRAEIPKNITLLAHTAGLDVWSADDTERDLFRKNVEAVVALQSPWCSEDICHFVSNGPNVGVNFGLILNEDSLHNAIRRVKIITKNVGVPFLAENPPVEFVVGSMDLAYYFRVLSNETDIGLVLDLGHIYAYSLLTHQDPRELLERYPLDRVCEIHIAGGYLDGDGLYVDNHAYPILPQVMELLGPALAKSRNLKALTYEFYEMPLSLAYSTFVELRKVYQTIRANGGI